MKTESTDTLLKVTAAKESNPVIKVLLWIAIVIILGALVVPPVSMGQSPLPILIDVLVLAMAVAIPIWLARRRLDFMAVWLLIYCIVYGALSWQGGYIYANFGGIDNRSVWYPAYCGEVHWSRIGRQHSLLRPLGWFFLPLILADRAVLHRTRIEVSSQDQG